MHTTVTRDMIKVILHLLQTIKWEEYGGYLRTDECPQILTFNRSIWLRLEEFVRKEARKQVTVVEDKVDSSKEGEKHQKSTEVGCYRSALVTQCDHRR